MAELIKFKGSKTPSIIKHLVFADVKSRDGVTLMSHSAGGHTTVSYLVSKCGLIRTQVLLDPVDGYDPRSSKTSDFVTHPPDQLAFLIPTLLIASGLSALPKGPGFGPCAPPNISNTRFYDCMPGPTWFLNFTTYGHADILDDYVRDTIHINMRLMS